MANTFLMVMEEFGISAAAAAKNAADEGSPGTVISNGCKGLAKEFILIIPFVILLLGKNKKRIKN